MVDFSDVVKQNEYLRLNTFGIYVNNISNATQAASVADAYSAIDDFIEEVFTQYISFNKKKTFF
jgi:hypothetical protein